MVGTYSTMLFRVIFLLLLLVTKCSCSCGIAVRWRNSARGVYFFEVEDFGVCIVILRIIVLRDTGTA